MKLGTWNYEVGDLMESCSRHAQHNSLLILELHHIGTPQGPYKLYKALNCITGDVVSLALGTVENHYRKVA